jgi:hypothetical protein
MAVKTQLIRHFSSVPPSFIAVISRQFSCPKELNFKLTTPRSREIWIRLTTALSSSVTLRQCCHETIPRRRFPKPVSQKISNNFTGTLFCLTMQHHHFTRIVSHHNDRQRSYRHYSNLPGVEARIFWFNILYQPSRFFSVSLEKALEIFFFSSTTQGTT